MIKAVRSHHESGIFLWALKPVETLPESMVCEARKMVEFSGFGHLTKWVKSKVLAWASKRHISEVFNAFL